MDNRKDPRFSVQFRSSFSSTNLTSGIGLLSDLSSHGCRIFSSTPVKSGTALELRIEVAESEPPLQVKQAIVRWARDNNFGVEFRNLAPDDWARLQHTVKELERQPYQREHQDETSA